MAESEAVLEMGKGGKKSLGKNMDFLAVQLLTAV